MSYKKENGNPDIIPCPKCDGDGGFDCFKAECGSGMKSRAKCVGIDKAQIARPGIHVRRNDAKPSDVDRATAQHPHGFLVSAYRWRH